MSKPRKDAVRSRAQIVAAASDLLAENADAGFAEIAVRSGLNQATVYRHFPDRSELFAAVMDDTLERFETTVGEWDLGPDSFEELLRLMAVQQARYRGLVSRIRLGQLDEERRRAIAARTAELFSGALAVAKSGGRVKSDLEPTGVILLLRMVDGAVAGRSEDLEAIATEALDLIMAGLRP